MFYLPQMAVDILDKYHLALCALVIVVLQVVFFNIAVFLHYDKISDIAGGVNFIVIAIITFTLGQSGKVNRDKSLNKIIVKKNNNIY